MYDILSQSFLNLKKKKSSNTVGRSTTDPFPNLKLQIRTPILSFSHSSCTYSYISITLLGQFYDTSLTY